jgi:hypothetical protein
VIPDPRRRDDGPRPLPSRASAACRGPPGTRRGLQQLFEGDVVLGGGALGDVVDGRLCAVDHLGERARRGHGSDGRSAGGVPPTIRGVVALSGAGDAVGGDAVGRAADGNAAGGRRRRDQPRRQPRAVTEQQSILRPASTVRRARFARIRPALPGINAVPFREDRTSPTANCPDITARRRSRPGSHDRPALD